MWDKNIFTNRQDGGAGSLLIGNWKMNGDLALLERFEGECRKVLGRQGGQTQAHLGLAVPDLLLYPAAGILAGLPITLGIQTCSHTNQGAHTGETSPDMAAGLGAQFVILGHSERRQDQGEDDAMVRQRAMAAQAAGLLPLICVGETLAQRQAGQAQDRVLGQVRASCPPTGNFIVAYEPVWAIGTGQVAAPEDAQQMHAAIRQALKADFPQMHVPIVYGGSMKPQNADALLAQDDIDGGLIGGASLNPEDLLAIYRAAA